MESHVEQASKDDKYHQPPVVIEGFLNNEIPKVIRKSQHSQVVRVPACALVISVPRPLQLVLIPLSTLVFLQDGFFPVSKPCLPDSSVNYSVCSSEHCCCELGVRVLSTEVLGHHASYTAVCKDKRSKLTHS